ncbi:MAG: hypothetical protein MK081_15510 [Flavobacteriales bacterium]|nr:hypothetical protein [Flavobacteriales bacterium]
MNIPLNVEKSNVKKFVQIFLLLTISGCASLDSSPRKPQEKSQLDLTLSVLDFIGHVESDFSETHIRIVANSSESIEFKGVFNSGHRLDSVVVVCGFTIEEESVVLNGPFTKKNYHFNSPSSKLTVYQGTIVSDTIHGQEIAWVDGKLGLLRSYKMGQKHGAQVAYSNGGEIIRSIKYYDNDLLHGNEFVFHENGELMKKINWIEGIPCGDYEHYDFFGNLIELGKYSCERIDVEIVNYDSILCFLGSEQINWRKDLSIHNRVDLWDQVAETSSRLSFYPKIGVVKKFNSSGKLTEELDYNEY